MRSAIEQTLSKLFPEMIDRRRYLHQNPELSYEEVRTSAYVAEALKSWGIAVRERVGGYGVIGDIAGGAPGPTVALRADMDALPIQDEKQVEYASKVPGAMHACGHDAHTATLLAVAKALQEHRQELQGHVRLLFQPAEEVSPGGALPMIRDGALDGVDVIYGIHLWAPFPEGKVYACGGPMWAAADEFHIEVVGKGGHGGQPHETVDSILIASQLVIQLQSIVSRSIAPTAPCVVSVGAIQGGTSFNVIADRVLMKGTVRSFDEQVRQRMIDRLRTLAEHTCAAYGAECRFRYIDGYPPLVNDHGEAERFFRVAAAAFGADQVERPPLMMPGEDFAYYLQRIPGCFMLVGAGDANQGIVHPHHHPKFDIVESAMLRAARLFAAMTLDYLESPGK